MTKIRYIQGVPHWLTRVVHVLESNTTCRRRGHVDSQGRPATDICAECGQFLGELAEMDDPNFYVDQQWRDMQRWARQNYHIEEEP